VKEEVKNIIILNLHLMMCDIPHFQEILKITMSLRIANRIIDFDMHKKESK